MCEINPPPLFNDKEANKALDVPDGEEFSGPSAARGSRD